VHLLAAADLSMTIVELLFVLCDAALQGIKTAQQQQQQQQHTQQESTKRTLTVLLQQQSSFERLHCIAERLGPSAEVCRLTQSMHTGPCVGSRCICTVRRGFRLSQAFLLL
jgi:hypothetical protein